GSTLLQTSDPVSRPPPLVSDRENANDIRHLDESDRVRKPSSGGTTNTELDRNARIERKATGATSDRCEHGVDLCQELETETFASLLVPRRRRCQFLLR